VYRPADVEAIKEAFLIKSQLTAGERPKRMMLQTANTEERAVCRHSLHLQTKRASPKKADAQGHDPFLSGCKRC
jgi:hypothetical protein